MRGLVEYRVVLSLAVSAVAGAVGLHVVSVPERPRGPRAGPTRAPARLRRLRLHVRHAVVQLVLLPGERRLLVPLHLRPARRSVRVHGAAAALSGARAPRRISSGARRAASPDARPTRATTPPWLDDSRARPLHRHAHHRRHRVGQDLGLHVSLRRAAPRVSGRAIRRARSAAWSWRSKATSAGRSATS